jgi:hypothetical protein
VFLGTEDPEVPTVFKPEVDGLLGFLAAQITARLFQRADERCTPLCPAPFEIRTLLYVQKGTAYENERSIVRRAPAQDAAARRYWRSQLSADKRKAAPMSVLRAPKVGLDSALGLIAKRLRGESEQATREPLPERWVELIKQLNEQERERVQNAEPKGRERPD